MPHRPKAPARKSFLVVSANVMYLYAVCINLICISSYLIECFTITDIVICLFVIFSFRCWWWRRWLRLLPSRFRNLQGRQIVDCDLRTFASNRLLSAQSPLCRLFLQNIELENSKMKFLTDQLSCDRSRRLCFPSKQLACNVQVSNSTCCKVSASRIHLKYLGFATVCELLQAMMNQSYSFSYFWCFQ